MERTFDVVIIGGGILGTALSYFISALGMAKSVAVIEQAPRVAFHTSGRNTGKIHAPYLYDPQKKRLFAKAAFYGYEMWSAYSKEKGLPFRRDGVIEVAVNENDTKTLEKYERWGVQNGLQEGTEIRTMSGTEMRSVEPEVRCKSALLVRREGSVNYATLTRSLMGDSHKYGTVFLLGYRAMDIGRTGQGWRILARPPVYDSERGGMWHPYSLGRRSMFAGRRGSEDDLNSADVIRCRFLINAAGGESVDIAHGAGLAEDLTDLHFRGEYWRAPAEYAGLTKTSIYSVPGFPDYPFLDPHWIVRVDGSCEIGPNAVPVFSPYGYNHTQNIREFLPKMMEMLGSGAAKMAFDRRFQDLVLNEMHSSLSKSAMVDRVRRFLPRIDPAHITQKGTAGIRSSVVGADGKFVPDVILADDSESSLHIMNYNSPGATGVLPFSAYVVDRLQGAGFLAEPDSGARCGPWRFSDVVGMLHDR